MQVRSPQPWDRMTCQTYSFVSQASVTKSISFGLSSQTRVTIIGELSPLRDGDTSYFDIANLEGRAWEIASAKFQNVTKRARMDDSNP